MRMMWQRVPFIILSFCNRRHSSQVTAQDRSAAITTITNANASFVSSPFFASSTLQPPSAFCFQTTVEWRTTSKTSKPPLHFPKRRRSNNEKTRRLAVAALSTISSQNDAKKVAFPFPRPLQQPIPTEAPNVSLPGAC